MKKSIALVGAGAWGKNHLRNLHQMGVVHSVVETCDQTRASRQKDYPDLHFYKEDKEVINNPDIKGVVIATSVSSHYQLTRKYLTAGKDVLVEKPMALRAAEGEELVQIADNQKRILMVGHILNYHPAVNKLKELIEKGDLGKIRYIYSNRLNIGKLRTEENVLWSFAPHDISLILKFMNNEMPQSISASGGSYLNPNIFDTTLTVFEFKRGVKGHIFVSWLHPFKEQKLVVVGSDKMAVFDDLAEEKLVLYPHKITWVKGWIPVAEKADFIPVQIEKKEPLREELLHFLHCMKTRQTPDTDGHEGLRVLKILEKVGNNLKG